MHDTEVKKLLVMMRYCSIGENVCHGIAQNFYEGGDVAIPVFGIVIKLFILIAAHVLFLFGPPALSYAIETEGLLYSTHVYVSWIHEQFDTCECTVESKFEASFLPQE